MYQLLNYIPVNQFITEVQKCYISTHTIENVGIHWQKLKVNNSCSISISHSDENNTNHNVIICIYAKCLDNYKDLLNQCCSMASIRIKKAGILNANYYLYYNFPIDSEDQISVEYILNVSGMCFHYAQKDIEDFLRTSNRYEKHFQRMDYLLNSQYLIDAIINKNFYSLDNNETLLVLKYVLVCINEYYDFSLSTQYLKDMLINLRHNLENYIISLWYIVQDNTLNAELIIAGNMKSPRSEKRLWTKRDFLSLILFLLWDVEFTDDFCTVIFGLHSMLVQQVRNLKISKKEMQKMVFFGKFITRSQIELFTFEDDDRFPPLSKGNKAIDIYSMIIGSSKYIFPKDKELFKVCCKIKKSLESSLFLIAEKKMIDSYSYLHQITNDIDTNKSRLYIDVRNNVTRYRLSYLSTHDLEWDYVLKRNDGRLMWDMKIVIDIVDQQKCNIRITSVKTKALREKKILDLELSVASINSAIEQKMLIQQTIGSEIVGMFYEQQYEGRIPQRSLSFEKGMSITKDTSGIYHFHYQDNCSRPTAFFYNDNPENCIVSNIIAIVGKNGTGKTTAFKMINMDSPNFMRDNQKYDDYIIVYKIRDGYYYSSNNENLNIEGLGDKRNLSKDKSKNSNVIFYNGSISMNSLISNNQVSGIDLSSEYIFHNEFMKKEKHLYDIGRKLQLFKDLGENAFYERFHFRPVSCRFIIDSNYYKRYLKTTPLKNKELFRNYISKKNEIQLDIPLSDQFVPYCVDLYEKMSSFLENAEEDTESIWEISIAGLSSGQYAIYDFYSRLHSFFMSQGNSDKEYNCFEVTNSSGNYVLLLDEIELYLHPQWQKGFIKQLISFLEWEKQTFGRQILINKIQVILSSNSPFFMSDLPKENICMLYSDEDKEDEQCDTFAQNIHTILKKSFFMGNNGLAGDFSEKKIKKVFLDLQEEFSEISEERKREIEYIISIIGEPLIKKAMKKAYNKCFSITESNLYDKEQALSILQDKIPVELLDQVRKSWKE